MQSSNDLIFDKHEARYPSSLEPLVEDQSDSQAPAAGNTTTLRGRTGSLLGSSTESLFSSIASLRNDMSTSARWKKSPWRHTIGLALLLVTVFLWTTSNFLASTIFADNTYSKPYYVTYVNSLFFITPLIPILLKKWRDDPEEIRDLFRYLQRGDLSYTSLANTDEADRLNDTIPKPSDSNPRHFDSDLEHLRSVRNSSVLSLDPNSKLSLTETTILALPFCFLWFFANYFSVACLEYTTVGSATILTSTSSIWTLLCGTLVGVEHFSVRKLFGVLASLAGVALISSIDVAGGDNKDRGSFPHKTAREVAIGDILALISAVIYGIYCVVIKKRIGDESRVNMPLFFGVVGLLNMLLMWPGFVILHYTGIETFQMPPTWWIAGIIGVNSTSSLVSDYCWAFAMLLTSPLVVTVGLSLTIPLSLVGQMLLSATYTGWMYWVGAAVVVGSFVSINHEEKKDEVLQESGILAPDRENE